MENHKADQPQQPNNMSSSGSVEIKAAQKKTKPEDKPFDLFINEEFIPGVSKALSECGFSPNNLVLENGNRPVTGGKCWMVKGEIPNGRRFWLCFSSNKITSIKAIALAETGSEPSVLESFLIDEKRISLELLISRLLQRLNGQKWLGAN